MSDSLLEELQMRGVKVADLATAIAEPYANVYTALKMERDGKTIRHASVKMRLEKIKQYLDAEAELDERMAGSASTAGAGRLLARQQARPTPEGLTARFKMTAGRRELETGSKFVVSRKYDSEVFEAGTYRFLRVLVKSDGTIDHLDIYGGAGIGDKQFARFRSIRPETIGFPTSC